MGENLAKASLFLYFATFMHAFDMIVPNGVSLPNTQPNDGITLQPKPFQLQLKLRFQTDYSFIDAQIHTFTVDTQQTDRDAQAMKCADTGPNYSN